MGEIVCPSGMTGEIRKYKVGDLSVFTDRSARRRGADVEAQLVKAIWQRTTGRGPYSFEGDQPPWTGDVLYGDRFYSMIQARILTRGTSYMFRVQCDNGICERPFDWEIDLNDMVVQELPDSSKKKLEQGNLFETPLPGGDKVGWSLLTGRVQRRTKEYVQEHGVSSMAVMYAARLKHINGDRTARSFVPYMTEMGLEDFSALERAMVEADCGYETSIEVECPECHRIQEVELPMGRDFFLESRSRWVKRSKKRQGTKEAPTAELAT